MPDSLWSYALFFFSRAPCEHNADEIQSCVTKASVKDLIEMKACFESCGGKKKKSDARALSDTSRTTNVASPSWRHATLTGVSESARSSSNKQDHKHAGTYWFFIMKWENARCGFFVLYIVQMLGGKKPREKKSRNKFIWFFIQLVEIFSSKGLFTRRLALNSLFSLSVKYKNRGSTNTRPVYLNC